MQAFSCIYLLERVIMLSEHTLQLNTNHKKFIS